MATPSTQITNYKCMDCQSECELTTCTKLECGKHFTCNVACLAVRVTRIKNEEGILHCTVCHIVSPLQGIFIFVDDSNIWIGAKKLQSKLKRYKTGEDHRIRIDVGNLTDVLAGDRPVKKGKLYGS